MNAWKTFLIGGAVALTAGLGLAGCQYGSPDGHKAVVTEKLEPYECGDITRLHTFQGVFLASQPAPADLEQAKKGGVKTVINLRHASEQKFDEAALVKKMGLTYHNPAWNGPDELTDAKFKQVHQLLKKTERPILLHCSSANRVGAHWLVYRMLEDGLSKSEALAEAKVVGLKSEAYRQKALAYVQEVQKGE